jgi:hypothetical protein
VSSFIDMVLYLSNVQFSRCMEHAIHLSACHFIRVISPTSARVLVTAYSENIVMRHLKKKNLANIWQIPCSTGVAEPTHLVTFREGGRFVIYQPGLGGTAEYRRHPGRAGPKAE